MQLPKDKAITVRAVERSRCNVCDRCSFGGTTPGSLPRDTTVGLGNVAAVEAQLSYAAADAVVAFRLVAAIHERYRLTGLQPSMYRFCAGHAVQFGTRKW